ncbi:MAG: uridine kinase family protein [Limnochordia bacterium]
MDRFSAVLELHRQRYPQHMPVDLVKLAYQNEFGPGHFVRDEQASLTRLTEEYRQLKPRPEGRDELFEDIGGGLVRLHLRALEGTLALSTVNRFFVLTAKEPRGSVEGLEGKLSLLQELLCDSSFDAFVEEYRAAGRPVVSHSERFRRHYAPAYRVVKGEFALFYPVFREIERLLSRKQPLVVAIDGRSGSGKSSLARLLQEVYGCSTVSMDHFFLRPEQRTAARLNEPGGNVDYERFAEEVATKLKGSEPFRYPVYNCQDGSLKPSPVIEPGPLTVVEGCYSHHPAFAALFDLKVFLTVPPQVQRERILRRSGPALLRRFEEEWIPLEELYFSRFGIEEQSQIRICTHSPCRR